MGRLSECEGRYCKHKEENRYEVLMLAFIWEDYYVTHLVDSMKHET